MLNYGFSLTGVTGWPKKYHVTHTQKYHYSSGVLQSMAESLKSLELVSSTHTTMEKRVLLRPSSGATSPRRPRTLLTLRMRTRAIMLNFLQRPISCVPHLLTNPFL